MLGILDKSVYCDCVLSVVSVHACARLREGRVGQEKRGKGNKLEKTQKKKYEKRKNVNERGEGSSKIRVVGQYLKNAKKQ